MKALESATAELDAALLRLEGAVETLFARSGDPSVMKRELAAMIEDRQSLAEELDAALAREEDLQALADEASAALGAAIEDVRAALEREDG